MSALLELAARCESANGPDAELDVLIAEAVGWQNGLVARARTWSPHNDTAALASDAANDGYLRGLPRYTSSLDAASLLVPEGWGFSVSTTDDRTHSASSACWIEGNRCCRGADSGLAIANPALALTAAALRAHAAAPEQPSGEKIDG